jgi:hypothetical protein
VIALIMNSAKEMALITETVTKKQAAMINRIKITIALLMMWRSDCEE